MSNLSCRSPSEPSEASRPSQTPKSEGSIMSAKDDLLALCDLPISSEGKLNSQFHAGTGLLRVTQHPLTNSAGVLHFLRPFTSVVRNLCSGLHSIWYPPHSVTLTNCFFPLYATRASANLLPSQTQTDSP